MSNFVMVPVPEDRVHDVYKLLATDPDSEQEEAAGAPDRELSDEWTDDEIRRAYSESTGAIKQVLQFLAANPDRRFHSEELYDSLSLSRSQWSGVMGAFGKKIKNRYGKSTKLFIEEWDEDAGSMGYEMPSDFAELIAHES